MSSHESPRVSVLIDSFNCESFVLEAVESVLRQSRPADQIVIADGSTDDSRSIIEGCARRHAHIKTVYLENRGQLATIAEGLRSVDGDLVFLLDGDDVYRPDHLEKMITWWEKSQQADLIYCRHKVFGDPELVRLICDRENHERAAWLGPIDLAEAYDWGRGSALAWCLPDYHIGGITSALSFRRRHLQSLPLAELLAADGGGLLRANADYMLLLASALHGGRKVYVPEQTVCHRVHRRSITGRHAGGDAVVSHDQRATVAFSRSILCRNPAFSPALFGLLQSEMQAVPQLSAGHAQLYVQAMSVNPEIEARRVEAEIRRLRSQAFALQGRLQAMEASILWRSTAPIRWVGDNVFVTLNAVRRRLGVRPGPPLRRVPGVVAIDITNLWHCDSGTGIQRVVRTLATELGRRARDGKKVVLINYASGTPMDVTAGFLDGDRALPPVPVEGMETLVMLDSSFTLGPPLAARLRQAKRDGIRIVSVCHDLLPLRFPRWFTAMNRGNYRRWLKVATEYSNHFACVSRATAGDLADYFATRTDLAERPSVSTWPLGRDFSPGFATGGDPRNSLPSPYALMVGTVEPRKNHEFVVACFERIRRSAHDQLSLVVVGRPGWHCRSIISQLHRAEKEGWLVWLRHGICDEQLSAAYRGASCVIQASRAEGFGLPVSEAANFGKPVVLSDIPVFREIVRSNGYFFNLDDHRSFADALARASQVGAPATDTISVTWRESAEAFWKVCLGETVCSA